MFLNSVVFCEGEVPSLNYTLHENCACFLLHLVLKYPFAFQARECVWSGLSLDIGFQQVEFNV